MKTYGLKVLATQLHERWPRIMELRTAALYCGSINAAFIQDNFPDLVYEFNGKEVVDKHDLDERLDSCKIKVKNKFF